jgi:hypothetical protein
VGAPGVYVAPPGARVKVKYQHEHHDNGKHKGWYK